ncbi:IclR family transcriptional regulator [Mesobacterium sp. TK19101]|uniref:IclR family transcriptional regulator n=1 Tax=Mesobacterium hydrothermale TaxID=3111907 RepID=A0ABU6HGD5_9RHOB|nr:IclR family transcriptional regulator [Mesobacterium sp. TK19101]MEC3860814.1 IclR family transcriptional regulator [Mesobacterium sp. TK19101]
MGTITKALELLTFFSSNQSQIGLTQFVKLSGRDKATVHRHLTELEQNGFLEQHPESRAYRLGPALLRLAAVREAGFPVRALLRPVVEGLSEQVGELAHASLLQGDALSPVIHADPRLHGTQVHFDPAEVLPLHATSSGLALLAFADNALRERVLSRPLSMHTGHTITDAATLRRMIDDVRQTGISQLSGAFDEEVVSQGAPLFAEGGRVIGAMSIAVPRVRARPDRDAILGRHLAEAARKASLSLGAEVQDLPPLFHAPVSKLPAD